MKNIWKYLLLFLGVFLAVFCVALPLFGFAFSRMSGFGLNRGFGMPGGIGRMPMMGGYNQFGGFGMLGIISMLVRIAIPLALLALLALGLFFLIRRQNVQPVVPVVAATQPCPNCGRGVQKDWSLCPYCGERLEQTPPPPPPVENL